MTLTDLAQRLRLVERAPTRARRITGLRRLASPMAATLGGALVFVLDLVPLPDSAWEVASGVVGALLVLTFVLFQTGPSPQDVRSATVLYELPPLEPVRAGRTVLTSAREAGGAFVALAVIGHLWPAGVVAVTTTMAILVLTEIAETVLLLRAERARGGTALEVPSDGGTRVVVYRPHSAEAAFGQTRRPSLGAGARL